MTEDNNPIDVDRIRQDTLSVEEGRFEDLLVHLRAHNISHDPHISVRRIVIETENSAVELVAGDGESIELREIGDG